jgi:hypothetical protein
MSVTLMLGDCLQRMKEIPDGSEGDTVFDPFLGSGTTGKMSVLNGRSFIGIERDPSYYAIAERRIYGAQPQMYLEAAE